MAVRGDARWDPAWGIDPRQSAAGNMGAWKGTAPAGAPAPSRSKVAQGPLGASYAANKDTVFGAPHKSILATMPSSVQTGLGNRLDNLKTTGAAGASAGAALTAPPPPAAGGSQSGPGILENWFNQRANGTDPGWEYAMGHGTAMLNRASAARGGFNSSAAFQGLSNLYANGASQREGQLDQLAAGASGEHQGNVDTSLKYGLGLAGDQANTSAGFASAAGDAQKQAAAQSLEAAYIKAGVDPAVAAQRARDAVGLVSLGIQGYGALNKPAGGSAA